MTLYHGWTPSPQITMHERLAKAAIEASDNYDLAIRTVLERKARGYYKTYPNIFALDQLLVEERHEEMQASFEALWAYLDEIEEKQLTAAVSELAY